jgi:hypothetical protein
MYPDANAWYNRGVSIHSIEEAICKEMALLAGTITFRNTWLLLHILSFVPTPMDIPAAHGADFSVNTQLQGADTVQPA